MITTHALQPIPPLETWYVVICTFVTILRYNLHFGNTKSPIDYIRAVCAFLSSCHKKEIHFFMFSVFLPTLDSGIICLLFLHLLKFYGLLSDCIREKNMYETPNFSPRNKENSPRNAF